MCVVITTLASAAIVAFDYMEAARSKWPGESIRIFVDTANTPEMADLDYQVLDIEAGRTEAGWIEMRFAILAVAPDRAKPPTNNEFRILVSGHVLGRYPGLYEDVTIGGQRGRWEIPDGESVSTSVPVGDYEIVEQSDEGYIETVKGVWKRGKLLDGPTTVLESRTDQDDHMLTAGVILRIEAPVTTKMGWGENYTRMVWEPALGRTAPMGNSGELKAEFRFCDCLPGDVVSDKVEGMGVRGQVLQLDYGKSESFDVALRVQWQRIMVVASKSFLALVVLGVVVNSLIQGIGNFLRRIADRSSR